MAKKKVYKQGASIEQIDAQMAHFSRFEECDVPEVVAPRAARPAPAPKAVRLDWDQVDRVSADEAWDAFLRHA
jgi:hypothetical protein